VAELARQQETALADSAVAGKLARGSEPPAAADEAAYRRWLEAAASPAHVEKLRGHFESVWAEALRRHHAARP